MMFDDKSSPNSIAWCTDNREKIIISLNQNVFIIFYTFSCNLIKSHFPLFFPRHLYSRIVCFCWTYGRQQSKWRKEKKRCIILKLFIETNFIINPLWSNLSDRQPIRDVEIFSPMRARTQKRWGWIFLCAQTSDVSRQQVLMRWTAKKCVEGEVKIFPKWKFGK